MTNVKNSNQPSQVTDVASNTSSAPTNTPKIKASIYLTEEAEIAFTELYINRLRKNRKADKSSIACEALLALYAKECHPST